VHGIQGLLQKNLQSGFRSTGICPFNPSIIPKEAFQPNAVTQFAGQLQQQALVVTVPEPTSNVEQHDTATCDEDTALQPCPPDLAMLAVELAVGPAQIRMYEVWAANDSDHDDDPWYKTWTFWRACISKRQYCNATHPPSVRFYADMNNLRIATVISVRVSVRRVRESRPEF
jgi:hypothetical protein